jgi:hypothetical protein
MNPPAVAARRLLAALGLGLALGLIYGFLRPLRRKSNTSGDLLFLLCAGAAWVELGFGICNGDLRLGYIAGLPVGAFVWEMTVGKVLRPVFFRFWQIVERIFSLPWRLTKKIFRKCVKFAKNVFASAKKWSTIRWIQPDHLVGDTGGDCYGADGKGQEPKQNHTPPLPGDRGRHGRAVRSRHSGIGRRHP